ncbi:MAG: hypothetical protein PVJ57_22505 [Phycisphaerae bacterium]|jgi:hypothetical protein
MTPNAQELMTPHEAARWFRRSPSWLRQQKDLLRVAAPHGQPLYHVNLCRAYVLGQVCRLDPQALRRAQLRALASVCGLAETDLTVVDRTVAAALPPTPGSRLTA